MSQRSTFSLASILLFTAVIAIFLAAARTVYDHCTQPELKQLDFLCGCDAAIGLIVGVWFGAMQPRPIRGVLVGIPLGFYAGGGAGNLFGAPQNLPLVAIGSAVLVLLGLLVRRYSARPAARHARQDIPRSS